MGVPTKKLVYDVRRKREGILTGAENELSTVDIIAYLNEFQQIWINNAIKEAERNQEAANELRTFKIDKHKLTLQKVDDNCVLAKYPKNIHTRLNQLAVTTKNDCCDGITKDIPIRIVNSDKLQFARKNPFQKSDFFFERLLSVISKDGLLIYHDGSQEINDVFIDYYRKPNELHAPSLEECDGKHYYDYKGEIITEDTEFEADNIYSDNFISDGASLLIAADKKDPGSFDLSLKRFLESRNMYSIRD
jgi:hypothetical protein